MKKPGGKYVIYFIPPIIQAEKKPTTIKLIDILLMIIKSINQTIYIILGFMSFISPTLLKKSVQSNLKDFISLPLSLDSDFVELFGFTNMRKLKIAIILPDISENKNT